jgi:hypothetical protein
MPEAEPPEPKKPDGSGRSVGGNVPPQVPPGGGGASAPFDGGEIPVPTATELQQMFDLKPPLGERLRYGFGRVARAMGRAAIRVVTAMVPSRQTAYEWGMALGGFVPGSNGIVGPGPDESSSPLPPDAPDPGGSDPLPGPGTSRS